MKYTVLVRARLKDDPEAVRQIHDQVVSQTRAQAQEAGDLTHHIFLNPQDPRDFLGIDEWSSLEGFQAFAGSPEIQQFFGQLFEGQPEVTVWAESDWVQW